ncbi:MAG: zinc ribbon domain-containing protein [Candidatus Zixiibacteriota bacterium]|nr:MAG: zinc ribbon domain-containing protein [candidate division Zixibacteria bacterium]
MPTYQYRCLDCGDEFEEFQSIIDPPLKTCKKCNGKLQRLISGGAGFLFKGSGFYITDHRSSNYKKDAAKDKADPTTSKSKPTETKKASPDKKK